jgi:hypothetical protein
MPTTVRILSRNFAGAIFTRTVRALDDLPLCRYGGLRTREENLP